MKKSSKTFGRKTQLSGHTFKPAQSAKAQGNTRTALGICLGSKTEVRIPGPKRGKEGKIC